MKRAPGAVPLRQHVLPIVAILLGLVIVGASQVSAPPANIVAALPPRQPRAFEDPLEQAVVIPMQDGTNATGWMAVPENGQPQMLLVLCHAYGGAAEPLVPFMNQLARSGIASVAMDFRGDAAAYKVETGVEDTVAATDFMLESYPSITRTVIYGFSMGGGIAGLVVAAMPNATFDYWVSGAGVANLSALWEDVELLRGPIQNETGGTPMEVPHEYAARSPNVTKIAAANLTGVILVHARADPVVSIQTIDELQRGLLEAEVPVNFVEIAGTDLPWGCKLLEHTCSADPWSLLGSHGAGDVWYLEPLLRGILAAEWPKPETAPRIQVDGSEGVAAILSLTHVLPRPSDGF